MDTTQFLALFHDGWISNYPLAVGSILTLSIFVERLVAFRGSLSGTRSLARDTIEALVQRDMSRAKEVCEASKQPIAKVFLEAMNWKNVPLEDLERVLSTSRQEASFRLKRGLWLIGTVGSLAPYVGLFGTVVGIIRAFGAMAEHGAGGFEVVAAGISEALIATAVGLAVAIVALMIFNFLQTQVGAIASVYSRSCERFVQAFLYVEASAGESEEDAGGLVPA